MSRKAKLHLLLCILMTSLLVFTSCSSAATTTSPASSTSDTSATADSTTASTEPTATPDTPLGKYDPPISITTIRSIDNTRTYMPGETWENNLWTQAYEEQLGIKLSYLWTAPSNEFDAKMNIAIASDDIPDMLYLKYDQFYRLAKSGKLADLSESFENLANPVMKDTVTNYLDGMVSKATTFDGKLLGLGNPPGATNFLELWYRDDWLANVGLSAPKNFDDVIAMMYAFAKEDPNKNGTPTVGLGVSKELWGGGMGLEGFFNAYHSYPNLWVEKDGKLAHGSIQPETKAALEKLAKLYADGVLDKDFAIKGIWAEAADDIVKDKIGLAFGPLWFGLWKCNDVMVNHPNTATWTCMPIPSADETPALSQQSIMIDYVACMSKDAKNPEALIKINNLQHYLDRDSETRVAKYHYQADPDGNVVSNFFHKIIQIDYDVMYNINSVDMVKTALETGDESKLDTEMLDFYKLAKSYMDGTDMKGYGAYATDGPGGGAVIANEILAKKLYLNDSFFGPSSDTMNAKLGNLMSKENEVFTKIIMGAPISEFDDFVEYWNSQGGSEITAEVNDWFANTK